jgi:hypothetical protein
MPKTTPGKWSLILIILVPLLLAAGTSLASSLYAAVPAGDTILADIAAHPALALTMLAGFACGIAACVTGLLAILRRKERALLVYLSTLLGAGVIVFLVLEFAFPE